MSSVSCSVVEWCLLMFPSYLLRLAPTISIPISDLIVNTLKFYRWFIAVLWLFYRASTKAIPITAIPRYNPSL